MRGKVTSAHNHGYAEGDHPRACGEKHDTHRVSNCVQGSPPRMRGKVENVPILQACSGITPAHAGKRPPGGPCSLRSRDHPRACGEKPFFNSISAVSLGSPPRMRGKEIDVSPLYVAVGITPAHAGKSTKCRRKLYRTRDHPRACGEKLSS